MWQWLAALAAVSAAGPAPFNFTPGFARDEGTLRFASTRPRAGEAQGMADIYVVKLGRMPN